MLAQAGLPSFDYIRAASVDEASRLLLDHGFGAKLVAGGTDLFPRMRDGVSHPRIVVDVKGIPALQEITEDAQGGLSVGAAVSLNRLAQDLRVQGRYPLLAEAASSVASYQIRNRATLGGNLCNASPAADTAPAVLCLDARLVLHGRAGLREVEAHDFFVGPGATVMEAGDVLLAVRLPAPRGEGCGRYLKLGRNKAGDLAIVGAAVYGWVDPEAEAGCRFCIALASVAPVPMRAAAAEEVLAHNPPTDHWIRVAADAAADAARPIGDLRASAAYRKEMVRNLVLRALTAVAASVWPPSGSQLPALRQGEA